MNNIVTFEETIKLFLTKCIDDIMNEANEIPKFNIIFKDEAFNLFYNIMNNNAEQSFIKNIRIEDIEKLKNQNDENCPTIYVKNHIKFFEYLTEITNNLAILSNKYGENINIKKFHIQTMETIWLRMGINDFNNVENFLLKQLEFIKNDLFEDYIFNRHIDKFYNYNVFAKNTIGIFWDESTKIMKFKIETEDSHHSLPRIYYDIIDDTCYIYAIQSDYEKNRITKIERLLYKLNKNIKNPNIHPNMVYSMKLFINLLKQNGINIIKVPTLQVLSYRFHELLSIKEKESFSKKWNKETLKELQELKKYLEEKAKYTKNRLSYILETKIKEYEKDKNWYNRVVDKEDIISELKTENLINLIYRIIEEDDSLTLTNDIDIDDTLTIKIKNKIKQK